MTFTARCCISADHPSLAGHFPGNPLVPGVVILDEVVAVLSTWQGRAGRLRGVPWVKFVAPLRPEQSFTVDLTALDERCIDFECVRDARLVAKGRLEIA